MLQKINANKSGKKKKRKMGVTASPPCLRDSLIDLGGKTIEFTTEKQLQREVVGKMLSVNLMLLGSLKVP